jgi:hypothetical protein
MAHSEQRVFAIRHGETEWSLSGQHFPLDTGTLNVLAYYRGIPAVRVWNGPLVA